MTIKVTLTENGNTNRLEENKKDRLIKVADRINESIVELKKLSILHLQ